MLTAQNVEEKVIQLMIVRRIEATIIDKTMRTVVKDKEEMVFYKCDKLT